MSELILRAEQGVLGALLTHTDPDVITANLTSDDFAHPAHQAVFTALLDIETLDTTLDERITTVARIVDRTDVDPGWLLQIAALTPAEDLVPQYTRIVVQAAFDRDVADFAQPYRAAALLADDSDRGKLVRLADALDAQAAVFTPASTVDTDAAIGLNVDLNEPAGTKDVTQLLREDSIIADLMQHPEQAAQIASWLTSDVFSTDQRRLTFEFAVSIAYDDDPFDTVTLAWQVQRARDALRYDQPGRPAEPVVETDFAYLTRLRATTVTAGTAIVVGRELLTEHVQATLALASTAAEPAPHTEPERLQQQAPNVGPPLTSMPGTDIRPIEL